MTVAELSTPPMEVTPLLAVVVPPSRLEHLEEALRGLATTVIHLDLVVLVVEVTVAAEIPEGQQATMMIVHGLLSLRRWPTLSSCHRRVAGKILLFPLSPHRTPF